MTRYVALSEVVHINPTFKSTEIAPDELVDFLPMASVNEGESVAQAVETRPLVEVQKGYTCFNDGDVLLAKITPCFENGKIAQIRLRHKCGFGSTEFHVLRPHADKLDGRYLVHFLRRDQVRIDGERKMTGSAGQRRVPKHFLESLTIPLPPLSEQRRIAAILDQADALRAKRREALEQLDSLTQSIFIEMFGDPARNTKELPLTTLGDLGKWQSGGTPPRTHDAYFSGAVPWFSSGELESMYVSESAEKITIDALNETSAKRVPRGSLMLGMYDTAALKASIAGVDCSCNQAIAFAIPDPKMVETAFVYYAICIGREHFRRLQRGVRQKNLNLEMIREIQIPFPPLADQKSFVARASRINDIAETHHHSLVQLDAMFTSLQHHAFRGEL